MQDDYDESNIDRLWDGWCKRHLTCIEEATYTHIANIRW